MLTDLRSILALAEEKGCAIPAFNCYTQECVMGVLEAAKETGAPVIFQMFSRLADTNDGNFVAPAILEAIRQLPQPAVMHLDQDRKSTRLNSSHNVASRMPSSA